ncbi:MULTISPECIES: RNA polymerase sigma factor [unclassified Rathayibacter]|uniref:RNA polymerase sigma factor n=1 Tax=unclassified Rathayibacter TaxID=2609250 RepID=UPI0015E495BE|nr:MULTISPECIES: sigma-70 family RNA polymerase sigma factor [unclassified Rathayibacter]
MTDEVEDRELLRRLAGSGGEAAMRALYDRHAPAVFRLVGSRVTDASAVDDVVQEAFIVLWRKRDLVRIAGDSLLPWLMVTARNLTMNENRAGSRRPLASGADVLDGPTVDGPERAAEVAALLRSVDAVVAALPELDRRIYAACLERGLGYDEAAAELDVTTSVVRNRLSRLRRRIRDDDYVRGAL